MRSEPLAPTLSQPLALDQAKGQTSSATPRQIALATTQLDQGKRQGDAFAMLRYRAALRDQDDDKGRRPESPAAGSGAVQGGWFTDAMLSGLGKYDAAVSQAKQAPGSSVDLRN